MAVWETCQGRTEEVAPPIASTRVGLVVEAGVAVLPEERVGLAVGGKGEQFSLLVHCASALRCNPAAAGVAPAPLLDQDGRSGSPFRRGVEQEGVEEIPIAFRTGPPLEKSALRIRTPATTSCVAGVQDSVSPSNA